MMQMEGTASELKLTRKDIITLRYSGHLETLRQSQPRRFRLTIPEPCDIASGIKVYRLERGVSKRQIADRAGIDYASVDNYEFGETEPTPLYLYWVLRVLGVKFAEFFSRIDGHLMHPRPLRHIGSLDVESAIRDAVITLGMPIEKDHEPKLGTLKQLCRAKKINWIDFWREVDARLPQ
jgi:transcriptional regulator with XRE-family HTH domain